MCMHIYDQQHERDIEEKKEEDDHLQKKYIIIIKKSIYTYTDICTYVYIYSRGK